VLEHANGQAQTYTEYMRAFAPRFRQKGHGRWQHEQVPALNDGLTGRY
jgi:hypothetical protein